VRLVPPKPLAQGDGRRVARGPRRFAGDTPTWSPSYRASALSLLAALLAALSAGAAGLLELRKRMTFI
jgi:hypothetical protein